MKEAVLLPFLLLATACSTVATVRGPGQFVVSQTPAVVWVTTADNRVVTLVWPQVKANTLVGLADGVRRVELPLSTVQTMRARQRARGRTALLAGGAIVGIAAFVSISHGTGPSLPQPCFNPNDRIACPNGTSQ